MASLSNIFIDQGSDFITILFVGDSNGDATDLTNYTVIAQLRKTYESVNAVSFTAAFDDDRTTGNITISLTAEQTSALEYGRYVYDVLISNPNGLSTRVVEGIATVSPSVSRTS